MKRQEEKPPNNSAKKYPIHTHAYTQKTKQTKRKKKMTGETKQKKGGEEDKVKGKRETVSSVAI